MPMQASPKQFFGFLNPSMDEGLETPGFGQTLRPGKHKTASASLTIACFMVWDEPLGSHQFPH